MHNSDLKDSKYEEIADTLFLKKVGPGDILLEEFIVPLNLDIEELAKDLDMNIKDLKAIIDNKIILTTNDAMKLSKYFKTSSKFWLNI